MSRPVRDKRLYSIWANIKQRCYNENAKAYKNYGGVGVRVCDDWRNSFLNFQRWALSHGYEDDLTIDRIDSRKDYCPENCQWIQLRENIEKMHREHNHSWQTPFSDYIFKKGYTVKGLAATAGVSSRSLEQYTSGRAKWRNSRVWFAEAIADALEIKADKLMEFDD